MCTTGVIGKITAYGAARVNFNDDDIIVDYDSSTYCNIDLGVRNTLGLKKKCIGEQFCTIPWYIDEDEIYDECD